MNGRSWSRLPLLAALASIISASAVAAAPVDIDSFDLPPGKSVTIEFQVTVDSPMPPGDSQVCNQGTFAGTNPSAGVATDDPDTGAAGDATCTNILLLADISVIKSDGATTEVPGTPVTYIVFVSNAGPATVGDGVVTDNFPASLSGCSTTAAGAGGAAGFDAGPFAGNINDTGITLPSGASVTYTSTCNIAPGATGNLVNSVAVSSASTSDPTPGNNSSTDSDTLAPSTDVSITKTDGATSEIPGTSVTYTIVASNSGPSTATGVTVADTFPASLSGCSTIAVAAGGATGFDAGPFAGNINDTGITLPPSSTVTYTATCTIAATATGTLDNTATITSATADPTTGNNSATDSDTLTATADLAITKTDGAASEVPGTPVTYTIVASNASGPSVATGVTVADTFPASLTGCSTTSVAAGGATGNEAGPVAGNLNDGGITLPVGSSVTYTATCTIDGAATGTLVNTASVSTAVTDPTPGNNSATDSDTLAPSADVAITKTDGTTTEVPGTPVTYTIVATNAGPSAATGVTVADTFPAILTGCSTSSVAAGGATGNEAGPVAGNIGDSGITLPNGGSVTYTATCNIDGAASGSLTNTATVSSATTDPNAGNNSATDTDTLVAAADVSISKTNGGGSVSPGSTTTYTIIVENAGASTATGVTVTDTFPAALTGCTTTVAAGGGATGQDAGPIVGNINDGGITLPLGGSVTYTATCNIDPGASGTLVNTASVTATTPDPNGGNNSATDTDTVLPLDYGDAPTAAQSGFASSYPVTQAQDGARHVTTGISLGALRDNEADGLPSAAADGDDTDATDDEDGVVFASDLVACGNANITVTSTGAGLLDAWIDWNRDGDWNDAGEQIATGAAVAGGGNLIAVAPPCGLSGGASFARFRLSTAGALTPTGQAANGEVEDHAVTLYGLDFGDAPDASVAVPFTFPVRLADDGGRHVIRGPRLGAEADGEANGQPSAGALLDDTTGVPDDEDGVVFTSLIAPGLAGTVEVTASAAGLLNAWVDWNADGDWNDAGEKIFTDQALVVGANNLGFTTPGGAPANTIVFSRFRLATASVAAPNGLAGDGEVEDHPVTIAPVVALSITKTDGTGSEVPGTPVTYTIVASNGGPSTAIGVTVTDTFPAALTGCTTTSVAAGGATGNEAGPTAGNINDGGITLPSGATVTYTATCLIDAAASGSLANTATIAVPAGNFDPNLANNSATDTDTLVAQADLSITKTDGSATEVPGTPVTYTIVVSNAGGPSVATGVTVADTFPGILTGCSTTSVAAGGATGNDAGPVAGNINDGGITLPVGASVTYTATCDIAATATGSLTNTASVASAVTDGNSGNNSATDTDTLGPLVDVALTKTDGAADEVPGTPVTYTIVVSNAAGPSVATGVTVADTFAAILSGCSTTSVAAGGATGNEAGPTAGNLSDSGITLPVGASVTYTSTCNIDVAATGSLANTASASVPGSITDSNPANNSATDTDTLTPSADVAVTKTDGAANEVPGTPVTYTIVASNSGPSTATGVTVADTFPGILVGCSTTSAAAGGATGNDPGPSAGNLNDGGITLPPGASVTYTATCNVDPAATGSLVNTASATSGVADPNGANDTATDTDTLVPSADVAITKTDGVTVVAAGQSMVYTIVASNGGPSTATGVTVTDTFVAALTGCSTTSVAAGGATGNDGGPTAGNINDGGITLPPGAAVTVTYTATCTLDAAATGTVSNTATITSATADPVGGNNSATDTDTIQPQDYGDAPTAAQSGLAGTYPTTLTLGGARHGATGPTLGSARDSETDGQPSPAADGDDLTGSPDDEDGVVISTLVACEPDSALVTVSAPGRLSAWLDWNRDGDWADAGEQIATDQVMTPGLNVVSFTVPCEVSIGATFARFRLATATGLTFAGPAADGEVEDYRVTLTKVTDLAIDKTSDTNPVAADQVFNYRITVENIGPSNSNGFTVTDTLPAAASAAFLSASGTGWSCGAPVGLVLTCTHGPLAWGATTSILSIQMQVAASPTPPVFTNTATVSTTENDPVAANNTDSVEVSTDITPPTVTLVDTRESTPDGELTECETVKVAVEEIEVRFSEPLVIDEDDPEGTAADDPNSYLLVMAGPNATFDTEGCADGVIGDDIRIAVNAATYEADTPSAPSSTVTLAVNDQNRLHSGLYRLFACDGIHDTANNNLDGDDDGEEGGDFTLGFRVDAFNLFDNGHLDCGLAPWQTQNAAFDPAIDHQSSPHSGAVRATQDDAFLNQCVALGALAPAREQAPYDLEGRLRLDPQGNVTVNWSLTCVFFNGPACTGAATTATGRFGTTSSPTSVWLAPKFRFETLPAGAVSARCGFDFNSVTGFAADLDALRLRGNGSIFQDGFESGDTSKWQ